MAAVYAPSVRSELLTYERSLIRRGSLCSVSRARLKQKLQSLRLFLQSLGQPNSDSCSVCTKKDLGQMIVNGVVLNRNLKATYYKDESDTPW